MGGGNLGPELPSASAPALPSQAFLGSCFRRAPPGGKWPADPRGSRNARETSHCRAGAQAPRGGPGGTPWNTKRKSAREHAVRVPPAVGCPWSVRGPGYLRGLRLWQVCQLRARRPAPRRLRSDSTAASAPRGASPTPPPTHCKMLQHRPGKETPARCPLGGVHSTGLPRPLPVSPSH